MKKILFVFIIFVFSNAFSAEFGFVNFEKENVFYIHTPSELDKHDVIHILYGNFFENYKIFQLNPVINFSIAGTSKEVMCECGEIKKYKLCEHMFNDNDKFHLAIAIIGDISKIDQKNNIISFTHNNDNYEMITCSGVEGVNLIVKKMKYFFSTYIII